MRYFLIYVILMIAIALTLGCSNENPICTSAFCVLPRESVEGDIIEIDEAKALAFLETLAVDTPEASGVSVADIVADTSTGGHAYEGRIITVSGPVQKLLSTTSGVTLLTDNDNISFIVVGTEAQMQGYVAGRSYEIPLYIQDQSPSRDVDFNIIPDKYFIFSYIARNTTPIDVSFATLIADAKTLNQRYQGHVIRVNATISRVQEHSFPLKENDVGVYIYIRRSQHPDENEYQVDNAYDFTVFVMSISQGASNLINQVSMGLVRTD